VTDENRGITEANRRDAEVIWGYHQMGHEVRPCSAAVGLGSHDLGVATFSAELYRAGLFPVLVFSGATSSATAARFPRGEAVHYREHAVGLGVPEKAILIEPMATNTGQNIEFARAVLHKAGVRVDSLLLISMPYMERRAYATCRKAWPSVDVVCASAPLTFEEYAKSIGDERMVIEMMVGDMQRVIEYPKRGFAIEQIVPANVRIAYDRLVRAGFDDWLIKP
jgi:uncharacterized SAM-binding protein YcdF (DUF218 family)